MARGKKRIWFIVVFMLFIAYFLIAARPIPQETVLKARSLGSLETGGLFTIDASEDAAESVNNYSMGRLSVIPFTLGGRFGYIDTEGHFIVNSIKQMNLCLSGDKWVEYEAEPSVLEVRNINNEVIETIENPRGYPVFLDGRTFIIGSEQNSLSETDGAGSVKWVYEFGAPLTCADAAAGLVLTGSIDGIVEVLDKDGGQLFAFEPGGSQYSVILGCAFSRDGSRFALVCGVDKQRFLLFERFGSQSGEYKIIYHEFLGEGFRRPVHISFIDRDRRIVFEREQGLGIYEINSRKAYTIALEGEAAAIDDFGGQGIFFVIVNIPLSENKELIGIKYPDRIFVNAVFKTPDVFLGRQGSRLFIGGGKIMASFELEKK